MSFNLSVILREAARRSPEQTALIHDEGRVSYAELDARSDQLARGLVAAGLRPGQSVGLQLPNIPEFVVSLYGVLKAGGVVIPMNTLNRGPEIEYFLSYAGADMMISHTSCVEEAAAGVRGAGASQLYVVGAGSLPEGARHFDDLLAEDPSTPAPFVPREAGDTAVLLYTSGTTGRPKAVQLTHFQLYMNADAHRRAFRMDSGSTVVAVMPLFHALGLSGILNAAVVAGGTVRLLPKFDPTRVLEVVQEDRATLLHGVPTMYHALLNHPDRASYDLSSLTDCGSAGAAIAAELVDEIERELGVVILEMYGLTESGPLATANLPDDRKPYSVGKPIWGTEVQVWGEDGERLPRGREHVGELVIRGHNTMSGYLGDEGATAEAFAGGWLHTGDLGYEDEDGFLFIVDRKKELIIRGGYNVYPREVEEVLYQHPAVNECAVVGRPDDRLGEEVVAYVSVRVDSQLPSQDDLIAFVRERLAPYKYPRAITFVTELPKGPTGKILKRLLTQA